MPVFFVNAYSPKPVLWSDKPSITTRFIMLDTPFTLPCGAVIKNRLCKAAMTERVSNSRYAPTAALNNIYSRWANTGAGLLITGNVVIDRHHLESAGNVCFDDSTMLPALKNWATAATQNNTHAWVQISHSGRQTNRFNALHPKAPSSIQLQKLGLFGKPKAMTEDDIQAVIDGFTKAATLAKTAGFTGVQVHAAHGYLLSQFLSPTTNKRTDQWGGDITNRSRLLMQILRSIRQQVGSEFPLSVKLNSSDFQRGGFTEEDSLAVVKMLADEKIDLLEISGGTYEKLVFFEMNEAPKKQSTLQREAYFIEFAKKIRAISQIPLMVTGGFRSYDFCNQALSANELDIIGMGRPFITNRKHIRGFLKGETKQLENLVLRTGIKQFEDAAEAGFYARQLFRFGKSKTLKRNMSPLWCSVYLIIHEFKKAMAKKLRNAGH